MSIVPLKKITLYGCLNEKREVLDELQSFGCLHVTTLNKHENLLDKRNLDQALQTVEALRHLNDCPQKLKQIKNPSSFDPIEIEQQILQNKHQIEDLQDEADSVKHKIGELTPWGHFTLPDPHEIANQKFWFYIVPHHEMKNINLQKMCAERVQKDHRFSYVVVISEKEPENMPGKQVKLPSESLQFLKDRLEHMEFELENLQLERLNLTRWFELFRNNLFRLEDKAALDNVFQKTHDTNPLFVLQGWIPVNAVEKVIDYAKKKELAIQIEEASIDELPPTLLENQSSLKGGEDILSFYMTPSYWLWDPSTTIFFSFAIFFAMIFSDAGYAILLGSILAFFWKRLGKTATGKKFRNVLLALTGFSLVWGILVGSYFGVSPSSGSYLGYLKIFDMNNYAAMMMLAVLVGVIHIIIANLAQAWAKRKSLMAIANLGWTVLLIGAVLAFIGFRSSNEIFETIGLTLFCIGMIAIVFFTSIEKPFWKRFVNGLMGLTRITGMFGDVLSYLRLFALGLASASLAAVFNDLAKQIYHSLPGFKLLFALLIILIGHGINFILSMMGGFIHGLRLNFIEFFNWGLPEEGTPFKAFSKKEMSKWNH
jgi:V/A-type H+-transporting ATPase subunit I